MGSAIFFRDPPALLAGRGNTTITRLDYNSRPLPSFSAGCTRPIAPAPGVRSDAGRRPANLPDPERPDMFSETTPPGNPGQSIPNPPAWASRVEQKEEWTFHQPRPSSSKPTISPSVKYTSFFPNPRSSDQMRGYPTTRHAFRVRTWQNRPPQPVQMASWATAAAQRLPRQSRETSHPE